MRHLLTAAVVLSLALGTAVLAQKGSHSGKGSGSGSGAGAGPTQPYAGLEARDIASLSAQEIADLLAGRGMGFALPAELNGYPGPMHVLELGEALGLDAAQRKQIELVLEWMRSQAEPLGRKLIEAEAAISAAFRTRAIDANRLAELLKSAEAVRSELRHVHLAAHLETAALLTASQRLQYDAARGYNRARMSTASRGSGRGAGSGSGSGVGSGSGSGAAVAGNQGASCGAGRGSGTAGCCCGTGGCGEGTGGMVCGR